MLDNIKKFFRKFNKNNKLINEKGTNKDAAKERLHLVLMQDRANMSADFLDLMKQEIIEVIKKYIDVDENQIDVKLTNKQNSDGTTGAPALYANIPIKGIKNETRKLTGPKKSSSNNIKQTKNVNTTNNKQQNNKKEDSINTNKKGTETNKNNSNQKENTSTTNKDNTNSQNTNNTKSKNIPQQKEVNQNNNNNNNSSNNNTVKPKPATTYNINPNAKNNKQNNKKK